ncbi:sulfotransferase [Vibrio sp. 10N.286.52.B1]|uniref:sulfotransferase n=1 Tax=Vibrio sp. 10N.286.52.B1 TaxID=3229712 RepID=UPI00354DD735
MANPNLFIIGEQKAGTSALYEHLKNSPNIFINDKKKEFHYLISNAIKLNKAAFHEKGIVSNKDDYLNYFKDSKDEKYILDSSTSYLYYIDDFYENLNSLTGTSCLNKIIVIRREPVSRTISAYKHLFKYRGSIELRNYIDDFKKNKNNNKVWDEDIIGYNYKDEKITKAKDFFGENLLILDYQKLCDDPKTVINEVCDFLDIGKIEINVRIRENVSGKIDNPLLRTLFFSRHPVKEFIKRNIPSVFLRYSKKYKSALYLRFRQEVNVEDIDRKELEKIYYEK